MNQDYNYNTTQKLGYTEQIGEKVFICSSVLLSALLLSTTSKQPVSDKFNASEVVLGKDVPFLYS